ncbi:MAG: tRNA (guanosine(37)-N1)-methyltransferase TrmD, partial [Actinobacteria bacterium]|nr:tRNA (guanosine(37)-N1)-methyltransferase TrmD [Actinomycetota bacterium]
QQASTYERVLLVCGRYEGFDERVMSLADDVLSIGDYVLTGGELPAMVFMDAVVRLLPGVLGHENSTTDESFSDGLLEYPQYTRPPEFEGLAVPEVLLSGNHGRIAQWRRDQSVIRTAQVRSDLLENVDLTEREHKIADDAISGSEAPFGKGTNERD